MKNLLYVLLALLMLSSGALIAQDDTDTTGQEGEELVPPLDQDIQIPPPDGGDQDAADEELPQDAVQDSPQEQPQMQIIDPNQQQTQQQQVPQQQLQPQQQPATTREQSPLQVVQPNQRQEQPMQQVIQPSQRQESPPVFQSSSQQTQQQQPPVREQIQQSPMMDEREVTSAPTNVKMSTPVISIDLIMDLYNKDIDFDIEYSGAAASGAKGLGEKRPSEKEIQKMMTEQMDTTSVPQKNLPSPKKNGKELPRLMEQKPYTAEDASYNKAMISLNNAQQLFASRRYTEAMAEINRSISFAPNIALAHSVKGSVHYMLRQVAEAKKSWERALELDPTMDNVRAILLRMY